MAIHAWEKGEARELLQTHLFDIESVHYRHPVRGRAREFIVMHPRDWVNVVALTPQREVVLVRQFRFGIDAFSLEVPGGVIAPGESPLAAAMRELREETGFVASAESAPRLLGSVCPNPAIQSNRCHLVLVEGVEQRAEMQWDADEEIEVELRPFEAVLEAARRGEIVHSLTLNALFAVSDRFRGE